MSTTRLIVPYSLISLQVKSGCKSQTFISNLNRLSEQKDGSCFRAYGGLRCLSGGRGAQRNSNTKTGLVVCNSVQPGAPLPPDPPPNSWKSWILGALITIIIPFLRHKWGPLFKFTKEVEAAVERAEQATEVIEKVAEEVQKVAEDVADELPEGGKLRRAIESVENAAEEAAKDAHLAEDIMDKMEEVEKEVESFVEPVNEQTSGTAEEANDKK